MNDGAEVHPRTRFDAVADVYEARPDYPAGVFEILSTVCGVREGSDVLEIGPGSGQATIPLLDLGARVTAIEHGAGLASRLAERTTGRPITIVNADFEDVPVSESAFDAVVSATAFHWVDPNIGFAKVARALRPGGSLALWWNVFGDAARPDPFHDALLPILRERAPEIADPWSVPLAYSMDVDARVAEIDVTGAFGAVEHHVIPWEGTHTARELRDLFATFSPWLALEQRRREALLDELEALAREQFNDHVTRPYLTPIYIAPRRP